MIFKGGKVSDRVVYFRVLVMLEKFQVVKISKTILIKPHALAIDIPIGWFDGAS
jgi:hypothetical protein